MEPGNEEQVADRHAVASVDEENIMRDVHIGKRGLETANEEQLDKSRRFEQEAPNTSLSSSTNVSLECPASGEKQDRSKPVLAQNSGHVDNDIHISALDVPYASG